MARQRSSPNDTRNSKTSSNGEVHEPDLQAALDRALELMGIPGKSGEESRVIEYVWRTLRGAGVPESALVVDGVHRKSPHGGEVGNLICKLPGTMRGPRRLLMAHTDTVPLCVGSQPVAEGDEVRSADPTTGLGADDRAGVAVVLTTALEILRRGLPHPPLTFFWPVQEEVGLHGARLAQLSALGRPRLAFNWDGGPAEKITIGATGAYRMAIEIEGVASHAGGAPEHGVSAIAIAGLAIADLQQNGWHGDVRKGRRNGTSNIGWIEGGGATNVVTDRVRLKVEARSHDAKFREKIVAAILQAFERAARNVKSATGRRGSIQFSSQLEYESFQLNSKEPCVVAAEAAVRAIGAEPQLAITNGGLDANWMTARGIPTVTFGCGQQNVHTVLERLRIPMFQQACRIALCLATASE